MNKMYSKAGLALMLLSMYYAYQPTMYLPSYILTIIGIIFFLGFGND